METLRSARDKMRVLSSLIGLKVFVRAIAIENKLVFSLTFTLICLHDVSPLIYLVLKPDLRPD